MVQFRKLMLAPLLTLLCISLRADAQTVGAPTRPTAVQVTVLSTMLAESRGIGEWGFAALLEVDGRRFLIDTGARPETVLRNSEDWHRSLDYHGRCADSQPRRPHGRTGGVAS